MRRLSFAWFHSLLLPCLLLSACAAASSAPVDGDYLPGELLVKFKPDVTEQRIADILAREEAALLSVLKGVGVHRVRILGDRTVDEAVGRFSRMPEVEYAEPNYLVRTQPGASPSPQRESIH